MYAGGIVVSAGAPNLCAGSRCSCAPAVQMAGPKKLLAAGDQNSGPAGGKNRGSAEAAAATPHPSPLLLVLTSAPSPTGGPLRSIPGRRRPVRPTPLHPRPLVTRLLSRRRPPPSTDLEVALTPMPAAAHRIGDAAAPCWGRRRTCHRDLAATEVEGEA
jgi:hypothetical protein